MKTKTVETITSNDAHVRLKIYDGDIPADKYWEERARLAEAQLAQSKRRDGPKA